VRSWHSPATAGPGRSRLTESRRGWAQFAMIGLDGGSPGASSTLTTSSSVPDECWPTASTVLTSPTWPSTRTHQGRGLGKAIIRHLVTLPGEHKKIILYAKPGTEAFYGKLGFLRMNTAMAIWRDPASAIESGVLSATP
jgi:hypothetical protein